MADSPAVPDISTDNLQALTEFAFEKALEWGPTLLLAIVVLVVGLWIVGRITKLISAGLSRTIDDPTLVRFLSSLISVLLKALLIISVASMVGIETTSFVAMIGAAGLAVGLALQGSLANFAGGVLILLFKPFKVGDFIEAQGVSGTVFAIQIFQTVLLTPDNKRVIVPNGSLSNDVITNYSAEPTRRVDFVFGIGYDDDIEQAKSVIQRIVESDERVLKDPEPLIVVSELADSSVNLTVRVWVNAADYWGVYFLTTERGKIELEAAGLSIPYPQTDVHVHNVS